MAMLGAKFSFVIKLSALLRLSLMHKSADTPGIASANSTPFMSIEDPSSVLVTFLWAWCLNRMCYTKIENKHCNL